MLRVVSPTTLARTSSTFEDASNDRLVDTARPLDLPRTLRLVHVPSLAADESLVYFDLTGQLLERPGLHGEADAMQHEPRRLLGNAKRPPNS